ncbi:MAG: TlpA disulfide reductase family protein [Bacteroidales bacterium]|jgi:thiol-disulfide isomerase/thioredoxin
MKKLLLSLLLAPFLFSCNPAEKKGATLTGRVQNLTSGFFMLGGPGGAKDSIKLDSNGSFTHAIPELSKSSNYYILSGTQDYMPFKLTPGMNLEVTFDANAFKTSIKFSGKGSDINNYLVAKYLIGGTMDYDLYKLEPAQFRAKQDSILNTEKVSFAAAKKDDANDPFWKTEETDLLYGWANKLAMFESYHGYFGKLEGYKAPADFYSYEKDLDINQADNVSSTIFKQYVSSLVNKVASAKMDAIKKADSTQVINGSKIARETAVELIKDPVVLDHYLFDEVSNEVQWKEVSDVQESIDFFQSRCKDTSLVNRLNATIASWKRLGKGEMAFEIVGKDAQGNTVKLSDFKGKLVYVDVWATWCGPCKYEIPYLDTLETDYHGKDIVFISYSIDEDKPAWLKFVPENKLQGVQIIGENAWESKLCKDYKIMGVPTFMLFDKEGKIVSVKMTRPSDKKTRERFDSLL